MLIFLSPSHVKNEAPIPPHDAGHMSELSIEYQGALQREKELARRYEDLFGFLHMHVKDSQVCHHIMTALIIDRWSDRLTDCRRIDRQKKTGWQIGDKQTDRNW